MQNVTDILIIGAGIAGVSLAYELAEAGAGSVCVIETESVGAYHASGRSAAMYMASYGNDVVRALTRASHDFLSTPPEGFTSSPLLHSRPHMTIAREEDASALLSSIALHGWESIELSEACALMPLLDKDRLVAAAIDRHAADIDTDGLYQGYMRGAQRQGVKFLMKDQLVNANYKDGRWYVQLANSTVECAILICAAGAWVDDVAACCGVQPMGFLPLRRTAILVDPPADMNLASSPMVMTADETLYFKPDAGRLMVSPADEHLALPGDAQPEELDIAIAVDRLEQVTSLQIRRVPHQWAGLRTFSKDRSPVFGFDPEEPQFFWFAGQGGYGFQMAPAAAAMAAALILGKEVPSELLAHGVAAADVSPIRLRS